MPFPTRFRPAELRGPRAQQFPNRFDLFQQLVGDALREQFGPRATVYRTESRDGGIDAFVEAIASGTTAIAELPAPQIIECKDHDDTRDGCLANVSLGWSKVQETLRRQGNAGWTHLFRPWKRARSYIYCVSAVLPTRAAKDHLEHCIHRFFAELRDAGQTSIEEVRVLDYSDLRDWFDRLPRLVDHWVGVVMPLIVGHAEHCANLTHFQRYLLPGHLRFIEPEADSARPRTIFERVKARAGAEGVLIKGVGGVGKTRTALEVAHLAESEGWRVLHALPAEPGASVEDLASVVMTDAIPTLLIFDYLDQMPRLDFGALRKRLLPEANRRGLTLGLLANLRPSALRRPHVERDALFTEHVTLQPSIRQRSRIAELTIDVIAPVAVAQFGRDAVRAACGDRPIIATLIAEELQRRALSRTLSLTGYRNGDVVSWLRKRLAEDKLVVGTPTGFLAPTPEPALVAAAAALAAAPLSKADLEQAACCASEAAGGDGQRIGPAVVDALLVLGWLEPRTGELATPHDVVADEVLAEVLWDRGTGALRDGAVGQCLAPALNRPRVLGRYSTALTRLLGPEATETAKEISLRESAAGWLAAHTAHLVGMLTTAEVRESAYALGGVLSAPAWAAVCVTQWESLMAPWLEVHGTHTEARYLLHRGLKELPDGSAGRLIEAALRWSSKHYTLPTANYVLAPLIARHDLCDFVPRAVELAAAWLDYFPLAEDAGYVLSPLVARDDLGERTSAVIDVAIRWLQNFRLLEDAQFVLHSLLGRQDLCDKEYSATDAAIRWLDTFKSAEKAGFVLTPLIGRTALGGHKTRGIQLAAHWLEEFSHIEDAQFVLRSLLGRTDLGVESRRVVVFALAWLEKFEIPEAQFVLNSLLRRSDLGGNAAHAIDLAIRWLEKFPLSGGAQFVLEPLLGRADLGVYAVRVIEFAMAWLKTYPADEGCEFLLKRLFGLRDLTAGQRGACVSVALPHLRRLSGSPEASYLLKGCLRDHQLDEPSARSVVRAAMDWLRQNWWRPDADFIFNRLLRRRDLSTRDWDEAADAALRWLRKYDTEQERDRSLGSLLTRPERLTPQDLRFVVTEARSWLARAANIDRPPVKLITIMDWFHRYHDPAGRYLPKSVLDPWRHAVKPRIRRHDGPES